jgi:ERO1-like protein alpha
LKRNELVALINTFGKVSSSVNSIDLMHKRRAKYHLNLIVTIGIVGGVFIIFMVAM